MRKRLPAHAKPLAWLIGIYVLVFFSLACRRYSVFGWDTGDFGNFHDMFWWTLRGRPFYFPSRGMSNFGLHAAFLWAQLVPVFWLFPSVTTLIFMQSLFIGLAGVPVYLIARKLFDKHQTALVLTAAFLLLPPIVSQHVNQVEEPSFLIVYLLFAFYFFMQQRFGLFLLFAAIACLGRENVPLAVMMFGVYAALQRRSWKWIATPIVGGGVYFALVTFVLMPHFRAGQTWDVTNRMFAYLGTSTQAIVLNALTRPGLVIDHLLGEEDVRYFVLLVQPMAWVLPFLSIGSLMALPDLAINLVADNGALKVIGWHYNMITGSFLFIGAMFGLKRVCGWVRARYANGSTETVAACALLLLVAAHWFTWLQPAQFRSLPYQASLERAISAVPPDGSVLVPPDLQGAVSGREHWYITSALIQKPEFAAQFEYVILDANEVRFSPVVTQEFFDSLYKNPRYQLIFAERNVFVFHRLGGASDWKVPPPS
jgi:uncharacterized membrane protein